MAHMACMTIEQLRQVYDEWRHSGLTAQQFCENIGIREGRLLTTLNRVGRGASVLAFAPFPLTPPYVPFGIWRFGLLSKLSLQASSHRS